MLKSLLWKSKDRKKVIDPDVMTTLSDDLNLDKLMSLMSMEPVIKMTPEIFLGAVTYGAEDIVYRQNILKDFFKREGIYLKLEKLLAFLNKMQSLHKILKSELMVPKLMLRVKKLEMYHAVMTGLEDIFSVEEALNSSVEFKTISEEIKKINLDNKLTALKETIEKVKGIMEKTKSLDMGVNLKNQTDAVEAIILSLNDYTYEKGNILSKVKTANEESFRNSSIITEMNIENAKPLLIFQNELYIELESLLLNDIRLIDELLKPYENLITSEIQMYRDEIFFYYGAIKLRDFMKNGDYEYCFPELSSQGADLKGIYSLKMAFLSRGNETVGKYKVIKNDIHIDTNENMMLITGPNNGGKTVLLESMAISQLLFQNGMMIPAADGYLPVYNKIFSHFHKGEDISIGTGRLGEEAGRVSEIIRKSGLKTLVLFNEPYVTTSPTEGLDILRLSVNKFISKGSVVYLVTHYLDILDAWSCKPEITSYAMETKDGERTYKAYKETPESYSHAHDFAVIYGIDEKSIIEMMCTEKEKTTGRERV